MSGSRVYQKGPMLTPEQLRAKIRATIIVDAASGCWNWSAALSPAGYGRISIGQQRKLFAHRVSYAVFVGPIPDGLCVCHHCDNPACVNPGHLYAGSRYRNNRDKVERGRQPHGETCYLAKLTEAQVIDIRRRVRAGESRHDLAMEFGVNADNIGHIIRGDTWKHLPFDAPRPYRGENRPSSKLTAAMVREIKRRGTNESRPALAREFGVNRATVHGILNGKSWQHVEVES